MRSWLHCGIDEGIGHMLERRVTTAVRSWLHYGDTMLATAGPAAAAVTTAGGRGSIAADA